MERGSHWSLEDGPTFITGDHHRQQPLSLLGVSHFGRGAGFSDEKS